jgi:hypothetical protein
MHFDPKRIFETLERNGVQYVVIGGMAAQAHGNPRSTLDLDIVVGLDQSNLHHLASALRELDARIRGANADADIDVTDPQNLGIGANFTLTTAAGDLDVFTGLVPGGAPYAEMAERGESFEAFGCTIRVVGLRDLFSMKRAAGRPKDLADISALTDPVD